MWTCTRCNMENPDSVKDCEKCGARQGGSAHPVVSTPLYKSAQPDTSSPSALLLQKYENAFRHRNPPAEYSALEFLSVVLSVIGVLSLLAGIIAGIVLGNAGHEFNFWIFLISAIVGAWGLIVSLAAAQLIHLFVDMGNCAYQTSMHTYIEACIQADQTTKSQ